MRRIGTLLGVFAGMAMAAPGAAAVKVDSVDFGFAPPPAAQAVISFDQALPRGFTLTGGMLKSGSDGRGAAPAIADGVKDATTYLAANPGDDAVIASGIGYREVSFLWGSIDGYNTLSLLDAAGNTIESFIGRQITETPTGDQFKNLTNRRVTFSTDGETSAIYGLRFSSTDPAFEVDNVAFAGAVPEPASWAMMIGGFGFLGAAMRRRGWLAATPQSA